MSIHIESGHYGNKPKSMNAIQYGYIPSVIGLGGGVPECQWYSQYLKWYKILLMSSYKMHAQNSSAINYVISLKGKLSLNLEA